jgi:hypothetical protein
MGWVFVSIKNSPPSFFLSHDNVGASTSVSRWSSASPHPVLTGIKRRAILKDNASRGIDFSDWRRLAQRRLIYLAEGNCAQGGR